MHPGDLRGVVRKDRWDRRQYAGLRERSAVLQETERRLGEEVPGPLLEDAWAALFKARPELAEQVAAPERLLRQVMQALMELPEYHEARQWTRLDEWASALGAAHLARKVEEWVQERPERQQNRAGGDAGPGGQDAGGADHTAGAPPGAGTGDQQGQPGTQSGNGQGAPGGQPEGGTVKGAALAALRAKLQEGLGELSSVGGVLWGTGPGQPRQVDGRQVEMADRLLRDEAFRRMARMAGRMYTAALARKLARGRDGVVPAGIRLGSDLGRVLPEESVALRHPVLRRDFLMRYAEGRLRQLEVRGASQERGPIICCVDVSGSMDGRKREWARAVALALLRVARRERRAFTGILFDACVHGVFRLSPAGEPAELECFASLFGGGGTRFDPPLQAAVAEMGQQRRADVVFITDGQASLEGWLEGFLEQKRRLGFRVFGVLVQSGRSGGQGGLETLRKFSDSVVRVRPAPDGAGLEMVFDAV